MLHSKSALCPTAQLKSPELQQQRQRTSSSSSSSSSLSSSSDSSSPQRTTLSTACSRGTTVNRRHQHRDLQRRATTHSRINCKCNGSPAHPHQFPLPPSQRHRRRWGARARQRAACPSRLQQSGAGRAVAGMRATILGRPTGAPTCSANQAAWALLAGTHPGGSQTARQVEWGRSGQGS